MAMTGIASSTSRYMAVMTSPGLTRGENECLGKRPCLMTLEICRQWGRNLCQRVAGLRPPGCGEMWHNKWQMADYELNSYSLS